MNGDKGEAEGHALDALLAAYAGGAVSRPLAALVESHLELKPSSRDFVAAMEMMQGRALDDGAPVALGDRDRRLEAIFAAEAGEPEAPLPADPVLPAPLRRFLGHGFDAVKWRWLMPGLREWKFGDTGASLLWAKGGAKLPNHTHRGFEATLVLTGSFSDETGRYARGDIEIGDEDLDHRPVVDKGGDCYCFVVVDAPLRLTGPIGRWIDRLQSH